MGKGSEAGVEEACVWRGEAAMPTTVVEEWLLMTDVAVEEGAQQEEVQGGEEATEAADEKVKAVEAVEGAMAGDAGTATVTEGAEVVATAVARVGVAGGRVEG